MKSDFVIKRGMNLPLSGTPDQKIIDFEFGEERSLFPELVDKRRWKTVLKLGDSFRRNDVLCFDRKNPEFSICAPSSGIVNEVIYGERRTLLTISYTPSNFVTSEKLCGTDEELLKKSGLSTLIKQRPFGNGADFSNKPTAIFVNAMNTAPFQAGAAFVTEQNLAFSEAGFNCLRKLAPHIPIYLSCPPEKKEFWQKRTQKLSNCEVFSFNNLHPSGNSSVHIYKIRPDISRSCVWTIRAVNLPLIGELIATGFVPENRFVAVGGPDSPINGYLKIPIFGSFYNNQHRTVAGDLLSGTTLTENSGILFDCAEISIISECSNPGTLLGWIRPGLTQFSRFFNPFLKFLSLMPYIPADCRLHGGQRAPIFNGIYDKVMPLNIMTDFLLKAVLADDLEEAVALGLFETIPEDLALCEYLCPSKIPLQQLIADALDRAKEECLHETC